MPTAPMVSTRPIGNHEASTRTMTAIFSTAKTQPMSRIGYATRSTRYAAVDVREQASDEIDERHQDQAAHDDSSKGPQRR